VAFEAVIGLEIHAQLLTKTKIFCGCRAAFGDTPNSRGCPVCLGLPGSLPVLNRSAVRMGILAGLALNCSIERKSIFARKNYFYPDLPKGYQISQYDQPLCGNGFVLLATGGVTHKIGITRIHLEEDAGKLIHDQDSDTLFDVNRCGTPLAEIVTGPDIRSPAEAYAFLTALKRILSYLQVCDCNMEEGSLRCDANISVRPRGETKLGTKTELKNMNSFRGVEKALEYEYARQVDIVESGGAVVQQTFQWDSGRNVTVPMRGKEDAPDYRYFPEPDLVPLVVDESWITQLRAAMPELPRPRCERFKTQYGLSDEHASVLTDSRPVADYYEAVVSHCANARLAAGWVMSEVLRISGESGIDVDKLTITPKRLGALLSLIDRGAVSPIAAKKILDCVQREDREPEALIEGMGLKQISDTGALEQVVQKIIGANPREVARYRAGEKKLTAFFIGQAMKMTAGKGNPREISAIVSKLLEPLADKETP